MSLITFEDKEKLIDNPNIPRKNKITAEDMNEIKNVVNVKLLNEVFPINKVEVFFDAEDHSNFLGFTWEMISQGRVPVGLDTSDTDFNEIGKTGGEKAHTLTVNEMPRHNHGFDSGVANVIGNGISNNSPCYFNANNNGLGTTTIAHSGGSQPHNNIQPYVVMAFWRRIA